MTAKGRKQILPGDEADAASRKARRLVPFKRGELRKLKRRMNKRVRRTTKKGAGEAIPIPDLMSRQEVARLISKEMGWRRSKRRGRRK
jgi:hypothetical protein